MPIYEYECQQCGHRLEAIQKLNDARLTDCPSCGAESLRKLVSAAAFRLKGAGWYETDFKKDNKRNVVQSEAQPKEAKSAEKGKSEPGDAKTPKGAKAESASGSKTASDSKSSGSKASGAGSASDTAGVRR